MSFQVQVPFGDLTRLAQGLIGAVMFLRRNQSEMSLRKRRVRLPQPRNDTEDGDATVLFDGIFYNGRVTASAHPVEDHAADIDFRIERLAP